MPQLQSISTWTRAKIAWALTRTSCQSKERPRLSLVKAQTEVCFSGPKTRSTSRNTSSKRSISDKIVLTCSTPSTNNNNRVPEPPEQRPIVSEEFLQFILRSKEKSKKIPRLIPRSFIVDIYPDKSPIHSHDDGVYPTSADTDTDMFLYIIHSAMETISNLWHSTTCIKYRAMRAVNTRKKGGGEGNIWSITTIEHAWVSRWTSSVTGIACMTSVLHCHRRMGRQEWVYR